MSRQDLVRTAVDVPTLVVPAPGPEVGWTPPPAPDGWDDEEATRELPAYEGQP